MRGVVRVSLSLSLMLCPGAGLAQPSSSGTGTSLDNPFDSSSLDVQTGEAPPGLDLLHPQPILDSDGTYWLPPNLFERVWNEADASHRSVDAQGRRQVFDTSTGHTVVEREPVTPGTSTSEVTAPATSPDASDEYSVIWPIPDPVGPLIFGELTPSDNPPPLPDEHPGSGTTTVWRQSFTCRGQAGDRAALDLWGRFDCLVYLVGPSGQVVAANNGVDVVSPNHCRLENVALPETGEYRVIVTTYEQRHGGRYWLSVNGLTPSQ